MNATALPLLYPQILVAAGLLGALTLPRAARTFAALCVIAGLFVVLGGRDGSQATELLRADGLSAAWQALFLLGAVPLLAFMSTTSEIPVVLTLGVVLGMGLLACANHLFLFFLGFELMSLSSYLLLYSLRPNGAGQKENGLRLEAAIKYFFSGAMAAALFLFGMSVYYAATGTFSMEAQAVSSHGLLLAVMLMACAALFKVGAFPLQFWLPDVYDTAAPELAGFMSTAVKAAGFIALLRLMRTLPLDGLAAWNDFLPWIAAATMTVGNILALRQERLARLLAYSSIAHAGYILAAVWAWSESGAFPGAAASVYLYLGVYLLMNTGAFLFLRFTGLSELRQLKGYGARSPVLAGFFTLMLLSLAGIPLTGGFLAKFFVIWDLVRAGGMVLAVVVALNSLVGLAYYFKLIQAMAFPDEPAGTARQPAIGFAEGVILAACAAGTVLLGILPSAHLWAAAWLQGGPWHY